MAQRDRQRWNPSFISLVSCKALETKEVGLVMAMEESGRGKGLIALTSPSLSTRSVLWPNQMSAFPENPAYAKPRECPTFLSPLTVPKGLSSESGQEA